MGVLNQEQCVEFLESVPVGRIGFWADGGPLVLPVNFAWYEDTVVFRTLDGLKLAATGEGQTVCFEVDEWDRDDQNGWSVVVRGVAREVRDWEEMETLETIRLVPWAREAWRPMFIRIEPTEISGRVIR
jgi:nitroimidazol reductase NimA-like FMN-containing flavoprotein (pyridoxamine 5'-phosphate oxidase superfamily)